MRQKIQIAVSVLNDPDLLLLDEPSTGLDVDAANDVVNFIRYLKREGKTVLLSTHNIYEITELSDNIVFLSGGRNKSFVETADFFGGCSGEKKTGLIISQLHDKGD